MTRWFTKFRLRFISMFGTARMEREMDEEFQYHLERQIEAGIAAGLMPQEARYAALRAMGATEQNKQECRNLRPLHWLDDLLRDLRFALRTCLRNPGFTTVSVLTLGLGIGANTAMFSLLDAVLLRALPVAEPHELFLVNEISPREVGPARFSWPAFERFRNRLPDGAQLVALTTPARFNLLASDGTIGSVQGQLVSGEYFSVLGIRPALGRLLTEEDNPSSVTILSYAAWTRRFARDPQVLGRTINLNGAALSIIGVAEAGFFGVSLGESPELWLPLKMQHEVRYHQNVASRGEANTSRPWPPQEDIYWLRAFVRIRPPATEPAVAAVLNVTFQQELALGASRSGDATDRRIYLERGAKGFADVRQHLQTPVAVLTAMVVLVLLIACANLANLLLARGMARQREIALRLSIGASRARLIRQLLTESVVVSLQGGSLGLLLAFWAIQGLPRLFSLPLTLPLDYRLLAFAAALSLATGLLFGSLPAFRGTRLDLNSALKSGSRGAYGCTRQTPGKVLVVAQVALSLLLVSGAALLSLSLRNLVRTDVGFDREHILTVRIDPQAAGFTQAQLPALYRDLIDRIESVPGVGAAAMSLSSIAAGLRSSGIHVPGYTPQASERPGTEENFVEPGYFAMMGMRLLHGRDFEGGDTENAPQVAIVNEAFARRYLTNQNPVGRRYAYGPQHSGFVIVGLVRDAKTRNPRQPARPLAYRPLRQEAQYAQSLEVRTLGDPRALALQIRKVIAEVAPSLPILEATPLAERLNRTLTQDYLLARLTGLFASFALLLACLGIYGLMSYRVARRTAELGIRMALGAQRSDILKMVVRESVVLVLPGLAAGLAITFATTRMIRSLLFELSPTDPLTLVTAAVLMLTVAIVSGCLPARRAARVDPMVALRYE